MKQKLKDLALNHYSLLTSVLIFLSFPSYDIWFLKGYSFFAWVALVPLMISVRGRKKKDIYITSFITGLIGNFLTYRWIGHFAGGIPGGYTLIVSMLIPFLSVIFAGRILVAEILSRRNEKMRIFIYPAVWVFFDWIMSIGYLAFPWTYWGYSQHQFLPFIQLASITGVLGINFILILANTLLAGLAGKLVEREWKFAGMGNIPEFRRLGIFTLFFFAVVLYGAVKLNINSGELKRDIRVSVVQSCISPWKNWNQNKYLYLSQLIRYSKKSLRDDPDMLIWSESATLENISFRYENGLSNRFDEILMEFVRSSGKPLLTGEIGLTDVISGIYRSKKAQNNAVFINGKGEVLQTYPKINLVPFGEWFPYEKLLPSVKRIAESYGGSSFVPGKEPQLFTFMGRKFGTLICYEGIFYRLCREYKRRGADFFVNITNDGWTDTYNGHIQHFSASVFRAIENGIWYVRSGNTGYTVTIDPYGRIRKSIPILTKGYLVGDLDFSYNHDTVYSKTGDIFLYIVLAFLFSVIVLPIYKKRAE